MAARKIADDIKEGDWISFVEDDYSTIDTKGELFYDDEDIYPEFDYDGVPEVVDLDLI